MKEPNEYEALENVPQKKYLDAGFRAASDYFRTETFLYKRFIKLIVLIDPYEPNMSIEVCNKDGNVYTPFYNPDLRHNNMVYKDVIKSYHEFMNKLVKKRIIRHKENDRKHGNRNN